MALFKQKVQTLGEVLRQFAEQPQYNERLHEMAAVDAWNNLGGGRYRHYTLHVVVRSRILYLALSSAALRQELLSARGTILETINCEIGEAFLLDVYIR